MIQKIIRLVKRNEIIIIIQKKTSTSEWSVHVVTMFAASLLSTKTKTNNSAIPTPPNESLNGPSPMKRKAQIDSTLPLKWSSNNHNFLEPTPGRAPDISL